MKSYAMDENKPIRQNEYDLEGWVSRLMLVSIGFVLLSIGCVVCGVMTFVYGADGRLQWPFTSASGIWSGIYVLCMGIYGISIMRKFGKDDLSKTSYAMHSFAVLVSVSISITIQNATYSGLGLGSCIAEQENCVKMWRSEQLLVQAFNLGFGVVAIILAIGTTVFFNTSCRLYKLTGRQPKCCC